MDRNVNFDLMRIFLCLSIITAHAIGYFGIESGIFSTILVVFLLQANGMFYILSGYFNLEKEFRNSTDIKKFYKNKIIYTLLPFLVFVIVWAIWDYFHVTVKFNIIELSKTIYVTIVDSSSDTHLWFLYPLFGLLLSTPFLSKMLHNMDEKELKILWYIAIGWNVFSYYLCYNFDIKFKFLAWVVEGWTIYFIGGYYYKHVVTNEKKSKWAIIGILGFVASVVGLRYLPHFEGATDIQPMFTLFCMACFMFWDKAINITNEKLKKVIVFLSKNTFLIYMFHMRTIDYVVRKFSITEGNFTNGVLVVIGAFLSALLVSYIMNLCLKPIQRFIDKKWVIK